ncbi:hypothetical protein [Ferrovibrio sp.]|uniref:hypothetical protein n=1 Tax=Ferrovibrio sp. TaxID=1917215 RepID=UPI0025C71F3B|nr:hypothetical protein [Ferrovibrio sp.]MBX3454518.1 hypothetical protein [Ferrovibrio sp.]
MIKKFGVFGALLLLPACSSITEGTTQTLTFQSDPPGGECVLRRDGIVIGRATTPGAVLVHKTRSGIDLNCTLAGYEDVSAHIKSDVAAATFGNIILGGGVGLIIDMASGANNKYDPVTVVAFTPKTGSEAAAIRADRMPSASSPPNWIEVEPVLRQHFEANRASYASYLGAYSSGAMQLVGVKKQDEQNQEQSAKLIISARLDVDGTAAPHPTGVTQAMTQSRLFQYTLQRENGRVRVVDWKMVAG